MIEIKKISDVFDVGSSKRVFKREWTTEGVPFYRAREVVKLSRDGHVDNELFISEEMFKEYSVKYGVPEPGDLLITGVGTLGICYQVKNHDRFYFKDGNIIWLKKKKEVSSDYIEYCYKSSFVKRQIESTADAAVVGTYTITNARETKIPLPPLETQKKIAAILDEADKLRQLDQQLIEKYDELTQSLFLDMFGDPVMNPNGWEVFHFEDCLEIRNGKNQKKVESIDGVYPIYGSGGIMGYATDFISDENSVIIGRKGNINKPILVREKFWHVDTAFGLNPNSDLLSYFYLYYFCERYNFEQHNKTVTIPSLTKATLLKIKIPIPPLDIQNKFDERVLAIETQKALAQKSLGKSEELFNSLLQKAFKGELV
ncbi:restriction endonuclease subunit S [Aequorivita sediminis]|uniref:restriction endonuclease subunit S n=1 Tax=Aequorivita sediminis TaxID=3073653 RepID=UPI0028AED880|nr:restriction endonuclease subunit S [Aequorivita sp. F6058]